MIVVLLLVFLSLNMVSASNQTDFSDSAIGSNDGFNQIAAGEYILDNSDINSMAASRNSPITSGEDSILNDESNEHVIDEENYGNYFFDDDSLENYGHLLPDSPINDGDTLKLSNLSDKILFIDKSVNIDSNGGDSLLSNVRIILNSSYCSNISNLNFENNDTYFAIVLNQSSNVSIQNNRILIASSVNSYANLIGINIIGGKNNSIIHNSIEICNLTDLSSSSPYYYGIYINNFDLISGLTFNNYYDSPSNTIVRDNEISVKSSYYSNGIYISQATDTLIVKNKLDLEGALVYGIYNDFNENYGSIQNNTKIYNNTFDADGGIIYLIRSDSTKNTELIDNVFKAEGNTVSAYGGSNIINDTISKNYIVISGSFPSNISISDIITPIEVGIIYSGISSNINVSDNYIISKYDSGGDYGVFLNNSLESSNIIVLDNYILSDNDNKKGNDAVYINPFLDKISNQITVSNNTPEALKKSTKFNFTSPVFHVLGEESLLFNLSLLDCDDAPLAYKNIQYLFDGVYYNESTDAAGFLQITLNPSRNDTIIFSFFGDDYHDGTFDFAEIILVDDSYVVKKDTLFVFSNITSIRDIVLLNGTKTRGEYFNLSLFDAEGVKLANKPIEFTYAGLNYTAITDDEGVAVIPIEFKHGSLDSISFYFKGDEYYNSNSDYALINVSRAISRISCANMTTTCIVSARSGDYFISKLLDSNGNPIANKRVQIGFNGKIH